MLTALRIQNFAIIDELEVRFEAGFNVLTGETGAGKSILVDALQLVLGGRASAELIRTGAEEATVEALFEGVKLTPELAALETVEEGGELLVKRTVSRGGRGRAWLNGSLTTVGLLERVARGLIDISGQHEHVSLMDTSLHLGLLDAYAGLEAEVAIYAERFASCMERQRERDRLVMDEAERERRRDYLKFQLDEIALVDPKPGEEEELAQLRRRLASAEKLKWMAEEVERALYSGEESARDQVAQALGKLGEAAALDGALTPYATSLRAALVEVEEVARGLASYLHTVALDPGRLEEVEERLEALRKLTRKHGGELSALFARRAEMARELDTIERHSERVEELTRDFEKAGREALALGRALSKRRHEAAGRFSKAVEAELGRLSMERSIFRATLAEARGASPESGSTAGAIVDGVSLGPSGIDQCELLLSPNPGEEPKPMARIASGGELSRVLLAIKRTMAKVDPVPTYLFDEVDSGIGGAVAEVAGRLLRDVSRERQVLCITHLPQIAACGDRHFRVEKQVRQGRTSARVLLLDEGERRREIARMLAGVEVTQAALKNAEELMLGSRRGEGAAPSRRAR